MAYKIEILPAGLYFEADANTSILDSAISANIQLDHSCRNGECGICTAELIEGSAVDTDENVFTSGNLLTCRAKPQSDLKLIATYCPELADIKQKIIPAKVDQITFVAKDIVVIKLRLPPNTQFDYLPGQYIDITYKGVTRSYSIANSQSVSAGIELHIRCIPNGQFSNLLINDIKKDSLLRIDGPKGTFFVRESHRPIIFLAGGTGFAPIKAMVEVLLANNSRRNLYVYWGMPSTEALYSDIGKQWEKQNENLSYIPVVSENTENWPGRTGFVHHAVLEDFMDLSGFDVYACGSPLMIEAAKKDFLLQGLMAKNFYSDAFTPAK
jgi:CDP-4-dehydro-6-deoxyglucose reductase